MDGIDGLHVRMLVHHAADGAEHAVHGIALVLAAVRGDQDEPAARGPVQHLVAIVFAHSGGQRVDAGVARHVDLLCRLAFVDQVFLRHLRRGEVVLAHDIDCLAVELFGPGRVDIVRTQAGLHVADRDLQVEAGQRSGE